MAVYTSIHSVDMLDFVDNQDAQWAEFHNTTNICKARYKYICT